MLDTKKFGSAPVGRQEAEPDGFGKRQKQPLNKPSATEHQEQDLVAELAAARRHLEYRGEANIVIAEWRDELLKRIRRNRLRQELIGLPDEEHDAIVAEVGEYKRLCAAISWSPAGRRP